MKEWLESNARHKYFGYSPDLFAYPLDLTIPGAERLHDLLASRNFSPSLYEILPGLFDTEFKNKNPEQVMLVYGEFLDGLRAWQENAMMQHNRFPVMVSWPHRLEEIIETSREHRQRTKSAGPLILAPADSRSLLGFLRSWREAHTWRTASAAKRAFIS